MTWNSINESWDPDPTASFLADGGGVARTLDVASLVQEWVDGASNDGVVLLEADPNAHSEFYSSEYGTSSEPHQVERRPQLKVCYAP